MCGLIRGGLAGSPMEGEAQSTPFDWLSRYFAFLSGTALGKIGVHMFSLFALQEQ